MGFVRLLITSLVYPTAVLLLLLSLLLAYFQLTPPQEPSLDGWDSNRRVALDGLTFASVHTNGVRLNVIEAGERTSPKMVVLLHGFPSTALLSWHEYFSPLTAAGYFVLAPDQRGYNQSDKPDSVQAYNANNLADDVKGLIEHYGFTKAFVIGHDWGAAVTWQIAQRHPQVVEKIVIMNVPHTAALQKYLTSSITQLMKSWYFFYFQLPYLPESRMSSKNYATLQQALIKSGIQGKTFPLESKAMYLQAWSEPEALTGMVNWYRSKIRHSLGDFDPTIHVPTQIIWGKLDPAFIPELAEMSLDYCQPRDLCKLEYLENASHWVQHDEIEKVIQIILSFLTS